MKTEICGLKEMFEQTSKWQIEEIDENLDKITESNRNEDEILLSSSV